MCGRSAVCLQTDMPSGGRVGRLGNAHHLNGIKMRCVYKGGTFVAAVGAGRSRGAVTAGLCVTFARVDPPRCRAEFHPIKKSKQYCTVVAHLEAVKKGEVSPRSGQEASLPRPLSKGRAATSENFHALHTAKSSHFLAAPSVFFWQYASESRTRWIDRAEMQCASRNAQHAGAWRVFRERTAP